ncbi:hypothetical protein EV361DRAFT_977591 [Lentinula raphanica]|uniref:Uncharacterized protein n=1 Tax=Lentinula raphanica TaxID=153919 RepID=A0AA38NWT5_9AGAR|nr:hypothetical protein F5878DRAFT_713849 [Lentinula raphanica]KAJ3964571.1 hypothetical protein EV361DRAFT_977591 [Lentinula raphanica]
MIFSHSTSMVFLAAVGMITVLGLPIPDEHNSPLSLPTPNVQVPAVQEISKRVDDDPNRLPRPVTVLPKWSPSGPFNPYLGTTGASSTIPGTGTAQKRPLPEASENSRQPSTSKIQKTDAAQDLPPAAYPPLFRLEGGRKFELKEKFRDPPSEQIEQEVEDKIALLKKYHDDKFKYYVEETEHCGGDDQRRREINKKEDENRDFGDRVKDLEGKLKKSMVKPDFIKNKDFTDRMKMLNDLVLLYNDDGYKKVEAQIKWIQERLDKMRSTKHIKTIKGAMERLLKKMPSFGSEMYNLGLAGKEYFGASFLSEAYFEVKR